MKHLEPKSKAFGYGDYAVDSIGKLWSPSNGHIPQGSRAFPREMWPSDLYYTMSFKKMCQWVANGSKLEDLELPSQESEYIPIRDMGRGQIAEVVKWDGTELVGKFIMRADTEVDAFITLHHGGRWVAGTDHYNHLIENPNIIVWPLKNGDCLSFSFED